MQKVKSAFSAFALLVGFICALALIYIFIQIPEIFTRTRNVLSAILQISLVGAITGFLVKKLKKRLHDSQSFTRAIVGLVGDEPLLHAGIWLFNIFVLVYVLPIHHVKAEYRYAGPASDEAGIRTELLLPEGAVPIEGQTLRWGASAAVISEASGFETDTTKVPWSAFALLDLFRGVTVPVTLRQAPSDSIAILAFDARPANATIIGRLAGNEIGNGSGNFSMQARKGDVVQLSVTADCHSGWDTTFVATTDVRFRLPHLMPANGRLKCIGLTEGGTEIHGMQIRVNGIIGSQASGSWMSLRQGTYRIRLSKSEGAGHIYESAEQSVSVTGCQDRVVRFRDIPLKRIPGS